MFESMETLPIWLGNLEAWLMGLARENELDPVVSGLADMFARDAKQWAVKAKEKGWR